MSKLVIKGDIIGDDGKLISSSDIVSLDKQLLIDLNSIHSPGIIELEIARIIIEEFKVNYKNLMNILKDN